MSIGEPNYTIATNDDLADYQLGQRIDGENSPFVLNRDLMAQHMLLLGGTGCGKSKFLELLCREMIDDYAGFCLIDPHGDLAEDVVAHAGKLALDRNHPFSPEWIHYIQPSFANVFGFDPFRYEEAEGITDEQREIAYRAWLEATVDRVAEVLLRKQGESSFEGMPRLERFLKDVLLAVGIAVDDDGSHLPLGNALTLLDFGHKRQADVYRLVAPHLPRHVTADFDRLNDLSPNRQAEMTDSTINRLRSFLSPIVTAVFQDHLHTIDFGQIIRNQEIVIVNLCETNYFSADQAKAIGGLIIHEILAKTRAVRKRSQRVPYSLIIDEASEFIGRDVQRALTGHRKFKLSVCLSAQQLSSFTTETLDLIPDILNCCKAKICFQQENPDDLEYLAKVFGYTNLDFTEHYQKTYAPDGFDWVIVESENFSHSNQSSEPRGSSTADAEASPESSSVTEQRADSTSENEATTINRGVAVSHTRGTSRSKGTGSSVSATDGDSTAHSETVGESETEGSSTGKSHTVTIGHSDSQNQSHSNQESNTGSKQVSKSRTKSFSDNHSAGRTGANSQGYSYVSPMGPMMSIQSTISNNEALGSTETDSSGSGIADGETTAEGNSRTAGSSDSTGVSATQSESKAFGRSRTKSHSRSLSRSRGQTAGSNRSHSSGQSKSISESESDQTGNTKSSGESTSRTHGKTTSFARSRSTGLARQWSKTRTESLAHQVGESYSSGISLSPHPLPRYRVELHETGKLARSINDQFALFAHLLAIANVGQAMVRLPNGRSEIIQVDHVAPPAESVFEQEEITEWMIAKIIATHAYNLAPSLDEGSDSESLMRFIERSEAPREQTVKDTGFSTM